MILLEQFLVFLFVASFALAVGAEPPGKKAVGSPPSEMLLRSVAKFNRAAAWLEQYHYKRAATAFEEVLGEYPTWTAARFNLGLAYLNLEGQGADENDEAKRDGQPLLELARASFEQVLEAEPDHLPSRYLLGIHDQHVGDVERALENYRFVHERDPEDPHVAYKYADSLIRVGRTDEANAVLEKIIDANPGFISAVYRLAQQHLRARQRERAMPLLERFKKLNAVKLDAGSEAVGDAYGTAGKYYHALGADNLPLPTPKSKGERKVVFSPDVRSLGTLAKAWRWPGGQVNMPGVAVGDVDADGDLDLCLTMSSDGGGTAIWTNDGAGNFTPGQRLAASGVSPCFGDFDNDGDLDLWLGCLGEDPLYANDGTGKLVAVPRGPSCPGPLTGLARQLDVDSDGDLDLLAFRLGRGEIPQTSTSRAAASSVWNNNRDGTWTDKAGDLGLAFADTPVAAVVWDDFDNDRDLDLFVFPAGTGQPVAWVNDRVGMYRMLDSEWTGCDARGTRSATSGDPDKDGDRDLLLFTEQGLRLYENRGQYRFEIHQAFSRQHGHLGGSGGQFADMDNDGDLDIVIGDANRRVGGRGPALLINLWPRDGYLD
ncbi:MAG: FG-GAP-like repeat-containing protein, partial [Pirellulales bacterium]